MTTPGLDHTSLLPLLPEARVGFVQSIEPITVGLSGAAVYAVTTSRGPCVLRVQRHDTAAAAFAQQLRILRRAADASIAPAILHIDEAARAVVSARVLGMPIAAAMMDPAQRPAVLASIIEQLRVLHALDASGISERDPLAHAQAAWHTARTRPAFPSWAQDLAPTFDRIAATLARDTRRVVSHNDVNPVNLLWDGTRAWLVDWEVAALGHPYYDLATLSVFLRFEDSVAFELCALHDGATLDERSRNSFHALQLLAAVSCGLTFLELAQDLSVRVAPTLTQAPTLIECYQAMRAGQLDMASDRGRVTFGLALLAAGLAARTSPQ